MYVCMYVCMYIYVKSAQHKSVVILWDEDEQLYWILKILCRRTDNLSARYNDHQKINRMMVSLL